jgi:FlaA1/EpsC-like NDP-sugar epimerase
VLFFEVPNALFTLERLGIWDIIYEHCSYFTPSSLQRVFELAGFEVRAINQVYDGQFLTIEAQPAFGSAAPVASRVSSSVVESVARFDAEYRAKAALWRERLHEIERRGTRAVVWGAGSKGVTFLNVMSVTRDVVPYAVDLNPRKCGRFVAGTGQAIVMPSFLSKSYRPQVVIIMNDVYKKEIAEALKNAKLAVQLFAA